MANFQRDAEYEEWMRQRLELAVSKLADGSADKMGRLLGYTNGGFVREIVSGKKPVGKAIVTRMEQVPGGEGWFGREPQAPRVADVVVKYRDEPGIVLELKASPLREHALSLASRFASLKNLQHAKIVYATMSNLLDGFEAEQRELDRQSKATQAAPAPARRAKSRQAGPVR